jgi:hypothetical protein
MNQGYGLQKAQDRPTPFLPRPNRGPLLQTTARAQAQRPSPWQAAGNAVAGTTLYGAGALTGLAEAAGRFPSELTNGVRDTFDFGRRLARPTPQGEAARDQVRQAIGQGLEAVRYAGAHPAAALQGVARALNDLGKSAVPDIRPRDPDTAAQLRQNFEAGTNAGGLEFQGAMMAAPEAWALTGARALTYEELVAKFLGQGFSLEDAEYLAKPYPWKGHHAIGRRTRFGDTFLGLKLPASIAGKPLPKAFMDSRFNLVKPDGISRGEFYELHAKVDPNFHGTGGLPDSGRWSRRDLGISRYDPVRQIWYGTPAATKKAAAGVAAAGGGVGGLAYPEQKAGGGR